MTATGSPPHVVLRVPEGWRETPLPPPDLSQAPGVVVLAWNASAPDPPVAGSLVTACFGATPGSWTPEAEPIVLERVRAMVSGAALRVARVGQYRIVGTTRDANVTRERLEGQGDAEHRLSAQVFLGFVDGPRDAASSSRELVGCFALCTDSPDCAPIVEGATVAAEFVPPPRPTLALEAVLAVVRHPSTSLGLALSLSFLAGTLLVVTRRRPRTK